MLELFDQDGHLTDEALQLLISEDDLNDLQRLEISEHLSFCDSCVIRYTALLTEDSLQAPPVPLYGETMKKIRQRTQRILFNRFTSIGAAACLALVFWYTGIFDFTSLKRIHNTKPMPPAASQSEAIKPSGVEEFRSGLQNFASGLEEWTQSFLEPFDKAFSKSYDKENSNGKK